MKKSLILSMIFLVLCYVAVAQKGDAEIFTIAVGGTFAKPKIIPALDKLALAQIRVQYLLTTTTRTIGQEKSTGQVAGAKLTAFLETTDGKLTDEDFQEITDHFYVYFQQKLKASGIVTVDWNAITATDFYADGVEKPAAKPDTETNASFVSTAYKGNTLYRGAIAFAFGKINKASTFCKKLDAPAAFFNLTVDFADVMLDVDIKTQTSGGLYNVPTSRTWKYNSAVKAEMSVIPSDLGSLTLFWNEKSQSESLMLKKDIKADVTYHTEMSQDPSRMKNSLWAFRKEMNPVVIETTRDKYKAAAKKALENYADAFVTMQQEVKKQ
jgi:hypothetical protein